MKLLTKLGTIFDRLNEVLAWMAAGLLVFVVLSITTDITMRFFVNRSIAWVLEINEYVLLWIALLGITWLLKKEGHIKIDILLGMLNPRSQALATAITSIIAAMVFLILTWYALQVTVGYFQRGMGSTSALQIPLGPVYVIMPVGLFLLFIQLLRRIYINLRSWRES